MNPPEDADSAASAPVEKLVAGQLLGGGRFQLKQILGQGGMGQVWLAQDLRLGEEEALKVLPPEIRHNPESLDDLRRETLKSRKLAHPNIVRIHDLHEFPDEPAFIAMEFVAGRNLSTLRLEQPERLLPWTYLEPLVRQLCDALEYAHGEKVIHRDLKPANLMLDARGRLKLADFGIAATMADSHSKVSLRHATSGTLTHMSPQQMDGEMPRATDDIYSLGATLYEMLTSRPPFFTGDIPHQVRNLPAKPIDERLEEFGLKNDVPPAVAALVMACLSKDPATRPQSARAVAEWIGFAPQTSPGTSLVASVSEPAQPQPEPEPAVEPAPAGKSNAGLWLAVAVVALALVAGSVWFVKRPGKNSAKPAKAAAAPGVAAIEKPVAAAAAAKWQLDMDYAAHGGANSSVLALAMQRDGKAVLAGAFTNVGGLPRKYLARLDETGAVDRGFNPGDALLQEARSVAIQPDGKIIAGAVYKKTKSERFGNLVRFHPDGAADLAFAPQVDGNIHGMFLEPAGSLLIVGSFSSVNGLTRFNVARLRPDGTPAPNYNGSQAMNREVRSVGLMPDGRILIAGAFARYEKIVRNHVAILDAQGTLDRGFLPGYVLNALAWYAVAQPDNKVIVAGRFTKAETMTCNFLVRFNPGGQVDTTFKTGSGPNGELFCVTLTPGGKILIAGDFTSYNGVPCGRLALLSAEGELEYGFAGQVPNKTVHSVGFAADGALVIVGAFTSVGDQPRLGVARLNTPHGRAVW